MNRLPAFSGRSLEGQAALMVVRPMLREVGEGTELKRTGLTLDLPCGNTPSSCLRGKLGGCAGIGTKIWPRLEPKALEMDEQQQRQLPQSPHGDGAAHIHIS